LIRKVGIQLVGNIQDKWDGFIQHVVVVRREECLEEL